MNTITQLYRLITWYAFTEVRCAWCRPMRPIRRAWLWPRATSHGMCAACFSRLIDPSNPSNPS